jgi:hypothetical protein
VGVLGDHIRTIISTVRGCPDVKFKKIEQITRQNRTNIVDLLQHSIAFQNPHTFLQRLIDKAHLLLDLPHRAPNIISQPIRVRISKIIVFPIFVRGFISFKTRVNVSGRFDFFDGFEAVDSVVLPLLCCCFHGVQERTESVLS